MSFIDEFLINFKYGFMKKGLLLFLTFMIAIGTYMYAYFDGKKEARYEFESISLKKSQVARDKMYKYATDVIDIEYEKKLKKAKSYIAK